MLEVVILDSEKLIESNVVFLIEIVYVVIKDIEEICNVSFFIRGSREVGFFFGMELSFSEN